MKKLLFVVLAFTASCICAVEIDQKLEIKTGDQLDALRKDASGKLVNDVFVAFYRPEGCVASDKLIPIFNKMSVEFPAVKFATVSEANLGNFGAYFPPKKGSVVDQFPTILFFSKASTKKWVNEETRRQIGGLDAGALKTKLTGWLNPQK